MNGIQWHSCRTLAPQFQGPGIECSHLRWHWKIENGKEYDICYMISVLKLGQFGMTLLLSVTNLQKKPLYAFFSFIHSEKWQKV
jgi:hypothetical protein